MKISKEELEFLDESNKIEEVYDKDSLDQAIKAWKFLIEEKSLTVHVLLKTHEILMKNQDLRPDERGFFRRVPVYIGGHEAMDFRKIPMAIGSWLEDVATSIKVPGKDGENIRLDHIEFERIHCWIDGNGRGGRIVLNWERVKAGLPILIIKESEKQKYYEWFR